MARSKGSKTSCSDARSCSRARSPARPRSWRRPASPGRRPRRPGAPAARAGSAGHDGGAAEATPPATRSRCSATNERGGSDFMVDVIKSLELRLHLREPGLELPRPARIVHQLRRQSRARAAHLLPRGVVRGDGPRLLQGRGQAARGDGARHRRPAARRRWPSTTRGATACRSTSSSATTATPRSAAPRSGTTACRTRPPWCATTRSGTTRRGRSTHFAESAVRAYKVAMTPPMAPVVLVLDGGLQEDPIPKNGDAHRFPKLTMPSPPQGESAAVEEVARLLVAARESRCSSPIGWRAHRTG